MSTVPTALPADPEPASSAASPVDYSGHTPMMAHYLRLTFKGAWMLGLSG